MSQVKKNVRSTSEDPEIMEVQKFVPHFEAALQMLLVKLSYDAGAILEELRILYDLAAGLESYQFSPEKFKKHEGKYKGDDIIPEIKKLARERAEKKVFDLDA